jgi:hypothetical protein
MSTSIFNSLAGGIQGLTENLSTKHIGAAYVTTVTAIQVFFEAFKG